ncbi:MAG: sulfurtransferase TusA family protein [Promethearchaeota archaeon]
MNYDEELDVQGQVCPMPSLKARKKLDNMDDGKILKVVTDYEPASTSVPRDIAKTGRHEFLGTEFDDDEEVWNLYFKVKK